METFILLFIPSALLVFWVWMFWDMSSSNYVPLDSKLNWTIAFVLFNFFTAVYYYVTQYRKHRY